MPRELWYPASGKKNCFRGGGGYNGEVYCAVSGLGCDDSGIYRNAMELEAVKIVCHLCHPKIRNKATHIVVNYNIVSDDNDNNNNNNTNDSILKSEASTTTSF